MITIKTPQKFFVNATTVFGDNRPFAKKKIIFFLESTIKNKLKSKISEF
jgi:hypothetical protein